MKFFRHFGLAILAIHLLTPQPAQATGASNAQAPLLSVSRLYEELEYEQALEEISRTKGYTHTLEDEVTLTLFQGIILAEMNLWKESATAFQTALRVRPEVKLPVKVSPKVEKHFEDVRKEITQELETIAKSSSPPEFTPTPPPHSSLVIPDVPTEVASRSILRPRFLIPVIGGGILLVAGGTSWTLSRRELSRLRDNDSTLATRGDVQRVASRGRSLQSVSMGLLGAGLVGLGLAAGLYASGTPPSLAPIEVSTDGTSAFVMGRWP